MKKKKDGKKIKNLRQPTKKKSWPETNPKTEKKKEEKLEKVKEKFLKK